MKVWKYMEERIHAWNTCLEYMHGCDDFMAKSVQCHKNE